jgi:SAM-dependent methyltransferase
LAVLNNIAEKLAKLLMKPFMTAVNGEIVRLRDWLHQQSDRLIVVETAQNLQGAEIRNQSVTMPLLAAALTVRALRQGSGIQQNSNYAPAAPKGIDYYLKELRTLRPNAFDTWHRLFENGKKSYYTQREASCSHRDHWFAGLFGAYIDVNASGRLLDIGCGPHGLPSYLSHYDPSLISGLDPLEATGPTNFEFIRGFNEFLPWPDEAFNTVVSGTSLDHVLSLERSLLEVKRVLAPEGQYLVWLASVPGSAAYVEDDPDVKAIDEFHMFHFDRAWIEPLFEKHFTITDATVVSQPGFDHVFYCLRPLK